MPQKYKLLPLLLILLNCSQAITAQRVVSLLPSATYSAAQMGADANIVGRTSYCPKPAGGNKSTTVGDAMTVSTEAIESYMQEIELLIKKHLRLKNRRL